MPVASESRFFLYGYYGQGNLGDDLLLRAAIEGIRKISPDASFVIRNEGHIDGLEAYAGIVTLTGVDKILSDQARPKWQRVYEVMTAYRRHFRECRWFVFGGGTVFHERRSIVPLALLLATCLLARFTGLRIAALGVGVSELRSGLGRAMLHTIIRLSDLFAVRDHAALAECRKAAAGDRVTLTGDLVFTLAPLLSNHNSVGGEIGDGKTLGLTVYPPALNEKGSPAFRAIWGALGYLIGQGWKISLLAFHEDPEKPGAMSDRSSLVQLIEGLPSDQKACVSLQIASADAGQCEKLFSGLDVVCGMRFHGHVLAAIYGVPFVGISVDNKIDAICRFFGMPVFHSAELRAEALADAIKNTYALQFDLMRRASCIASAERNFTEFARLISSTGMREPVTVRH